MGGTNDGNSDRGRGSGNGSFRGGSGGGGPGGPGGPRGPASPGGPPDDPDDWGSNHEAYWHPANGWVAVRGPRGERGEQGPAGQDANQIPEFNQCKDRLNKEAKLDVKKPDPFDGSDRWKWEPFLSQVRRTFMAKPTIYENDLDKIGFAVSYLVGAAATHYDNLLKQEEAGLLVPALHTWIDFVAEFTSYFGLFDPARDAQVKLAWIKQMDNESFATFIIRFQEYVFKMGYNDTALVAMLRGAVTRSLDVTVAAQTHPPQNYPQWVQRFQELDNSIRATNAAHSRGGNMNFGMYNPMAPANPQYSNQRQGFNPNNPQRAGGQQGRNQGNWNNRQRGAAAWDSNVNLDNSNSTVHGQSEDFGSASSQNGISGEGLEVQGGNDVVLKNPGDEEFLQAIRMARTPEQVEEFRRRQKLGLCYNCGGSDHIGKDCKNPENWDPPKN